MKSLSIWSVVVLLSLGLSACGSKDETPSDTSQKDQNLRGTDNSTVDAPTTDSLDRSPTPKGFTPQPKTNTAKQYPDAPPAAPPLPKSKLLDSIGRALLKGARSATENAGGANK